MAPNAQVVVPAFLLVTIIYLGVSNRALKVELNDAVSVVEREQNTKLSAMKQCQDDLLTLTTDLKKLHTDYDECQVQKIAQSKDLGTLAETKQELEEKKTKVRVLEKAEKELEQKKKDLQDKEQEVQKIKMESDKITTELGEAKSKSEALEAELRTAQAELAKLKEKPA